MRSGGIFFFILIIAVFILLSAGCSNVEEPLDVNNMSTDDDGPTTPSQPKITASDGETEDLFGCSVSTDGYYAVVGAYQDDDKALDAGAAYIFHWNGLWWKEQR